MTLEIQSNIPEIQENTIIYKGNKYKLIRMSDDGVLATGTPLEFGKKGLLSIQNDKIWVYGIPEEYLPYAVINEIECPDVLAGEGLCLVGLKIELEQVPKNILESYLVWRYDFFENMERFWTEIGKNSEYAKEMRACYEYLKGEIERRRVIPEISGMIGNIVI